MGRTLAARIKRAEHKVLRRKGALYEAEKKYQELVAESHERAIKELASMMLPTLLARRHDLGMGGEPDEAFVRIAMDLAEKIVNRKTEKGPRTLIQEAVQETREGIKCK
jgi:hypothetical protein